MRFSIRNAKKDAVREPLIGLFFFFDIWIQREKLDKGRGSWLDPKISIFFAPP